MSKYADLLAGPSFDKKPPDLKKVLCDAVFMLEQFGIPVDGLTPRRLERMALCFLSVAGIDGTGNWSKAKDIKQNVSMRSRDIIAYINAKLHDSISSGSYDDIRRKDLLLLVAGGVVLNTRPDSARNDSTRGYAFSPTHAALVRKFGAPGWTQETVKTFAERTTLAQKLDERRSTPVMKVMLPNRKVLGLTSGAHNLLQKEVVEKFLPRFGNGAEVLYLGDSANKLLYINEKKLKELRFFELSHGELPDVIAYSERKNWLFLIEAVHSFGAISRMRQLNLERLTEKCTAGIVYVTAFLDKKTFRKFACDIAWETEVWIAESPDHMVHFNGDKFQGPYR